MVKNFIVVFSHCRWAERLVYEFTHKRPGERFEKPAEIAEMETVDTAFRDC